MSTNKDLSSSRKAFTLIELLVVIAIISLLATLGIAALNNARKSARDTKRLAGLRQLVTALELYYDTYQSYPTTSSYGEGTSVTGCTGGWDCSHINQDGDANGDFMEFLVSSGIMTQTPDDPLYPDGSDPNSNSHHYKYYAWPASSTGIVYNCERPYYVFVVYGLETDNHTDDSTVCYNAGNWNTNPYHYVYVGQIK
jgi:prepilin-type N-terminal cleavage/methylation domain-containing protein